MKAIKNFDIVNPSSQERGAVSCYVYALLKSQILKHRRNVEGQKIIERLWGRP
ncbi:hypothetical protein D1AOALGA4SA_12331 [Olavius algarvensis Delta 1 endosymbiont]|nr:hypothetical protein D1AOALGA4SA_12331 [Olavius algarvensis Delta 1 endosymbiont]